MIRIVRIFCLAAVVCAAFALPAAASYWSGHNGTIHLSFSEGDTLKATTTAEPMPGLDAILVDLYAVIADLDPVVWKGELIASMGGFEFQLAVEGAEFEVMGKEYSFKHFDAATEPFRCQVGIYPGVSLLSPRVTLVHWTLKLPADARNVKFALDPVGCPSCLKTEGCAADGPPAIWAGTIAADTAGFIFGAGYVPAYLNWEGEADLTPVRGTGDWSESGYFDPPE